MKSIAWAIIISGWMIEAAIRKHAFSDEENVVMLICVGAFLISLML